MCPLRSLNEVQASSHCGPAMDVETLGDAWRAGWTASARCLGRNASTKNGTKPCSHKVDLDMPGKGSRAMMGG